MLEVIRVLAAANASGQAALEPAGDRILRSFADPGPGPATLAKPEEAVSPIRFADPTDRTLPPESGNSDEPRQLPAKPEASGPRLFVLSANLAEGSADASDNVTLYHSMQSGSFPDHAIVLHCEHAVTTARTTSPANAGNSPGLRGPGGADRHRTASRRHPRHVDGLTSR